MNSVVILLIGLLSQAFFSARTLVQWIMSERARKVLSPTLFWVFSICGAYLLFIYGWLRDDFAIVLGQLISYYIYLWNLKIKKIKIPNLLRYILLFTPVVAFVAVLANASEVATKFFSNSEVPLWLLIYGSAGQVIFTFRFIYQWYYSYKIGVSELPRGFWIISVVGCVTILSYGIVRLDPIVILGQAFGLVVYVRNLIIGYKSEKEKQPATPPAAKE